MTTFDDYDLAALHSAIINYDNNAQMFSFGDLRSASLKCLEKVNGVENLALWKASIENLPRLFRSHAKEGWLMSYELATQILIFLEKPSNITYILEQPNGEDDFALFCCNYAVQYAVYDDLPKENVFLDTLSKWSGLKLSENNKVYLDVLVKHLYGEACWLLYGYAVSDSGDSIKLANVVQEIARERPPLTFKTKTARASISHDALPNDLSNN